VVSHGKTSINLPYSTVLKDQKVDLINWVWSSDRGISRLMVRYQIGPIIQLWRDEYLTSPARSKSKFPSLMQIPHLSTESLLDQYMVSLNLKGYKVILAMFMKWHRQMEIGIYCACGFAGKNAAENVPGSKGRKLPYIAQSYAMRVQVKHSLKPVRVLFSYSNFRRTQPPNLQGINWNIWVSWYKTYPHFYA